VFDDYDESDEGLAERGVWRRFVVGVGDSRAVAVEKIGILVGLVKEGNVKDVLDELVVRLGPSLFRRNLCTQRWEGGKADLFTFERSFSNTNDLPIQSSRRQPSEPSERPLVVYLKLEREP
jgi:hypothetical protein